MFIQEMAKGEIPIYLVRDLFCKSFRAHSARRLGGHLYRKTTATLGGAVEVNGARYCGVRKRASLVLKFILHALLALVISLVASTQGIGRGGG